MKTTPDHITHLADSEVIVFGANLAGRHGKGLALTCQRKWGARNGQGTGLMGQCYGIATKDGRGGGSLRDAILRVDQIGVQVDHFLRFATLHPELEFLVTEIGCGLAHFTPAQIAPLFRGELPPNVSLPSRFWAVLHAPRPTH